MHFSAEATNIDKSRAERTFSAFVCSVCSRFGSWAFFRRFPFKANAYNAYKCIQGRSKTGMSPTADWDSSVCIRPGRKLHTESAYAEGAPDPRHRLMKGVIAPAARRGWPRGRLAPHCPQKAFWTVFRGQRGRTLPSPSPEASYGPFCGRGGSDLQNVLAWTKAHCPSRTFGRPPSLVGSDVRFRRPAIGFGGGEDVLVFRRWRTFRNWTRCRITGIVFTIPSRKTGLYAFCMYLYAVCMHFRPAWPKANKE